MIYHNATITTTAYMKVGMLPCTGLPNSMITPHMQILPHLAKNEQDIAHQNESKCLENTRLVIL